MTSVSNDLLAGCGVCRADAGDHELGLDCQFR